ncbi:hypothetical protein BDW69DRAFT_177539 [Aspergillus filifer]
MHSTASSRGPSPFSVNAATSADILGSSRRIWSKVSATVTPSNVQLVLLTRETKRAV